MTRKRTNIFVLMLALVCLLPLSACSSQDSVETKNTSRVVVSVQQSECENENTESTSSGSIINGNKVDIPDEFNDRQNNDTDFYGGAYSSWPFVSPVSDVRDVWESLGSKTDCNLPTFNGRYGIVLSMDLVKTGDCVDLVYTDGKILSAVVLDVKSNSDGAFESGGIAIGDVDGNGNLKVCEWIMEPHGLYDGGADELRSSSIGWALTGSVDYMIVGSNVLETDDIPAGATNQTASGSTGSSSTSVSGVTGNLKITTHHDWGLYGNRSSPEPSDDTFPVESYLSTGSHDGNSGDASKCNIDKSLLNNEAGGHGALTEARYIVLHSTESSASDNEAEGIVHFWENRTDGNAGVGAHFIVQRDGKIYQWVDIDQVTWNAGGRGDASQTCSCTRQHTEFEDDVVQNGLNNYSISIEICHKTGDGEYPEAQLEAVDNLIAYLGGGGGTAQENEDACEAEKNSEDSDYDAKTGNEIIDRALAEKGVAEYVYGACSEHTFDCSGFVSYCLTGEYKRLGSTTTFMGWKQVSDPQPGDVCVNSGHCGIYYQDGTMIHCATEGVGVIVGPVQDGMIYVRYEG